jgi:signal transduction histidine kinase
VQRRLGPDSPGDADLGAAVQALEGTLAELRRLAHGVRPSRLDDGLSAALAHLVRDSAVPVELVVEDAPLPDLAAVTAYYVVAESVANATKHAGATRIAVAVRVGGGRLHVTVSDDGVGGAQDGFGLTSLRDRVGSAGGRITVDSPAGSGTTVTAVIPCGS